MNSNELIDGLISETYHHIFRTEKFVGLNDSQLKCKTKNEWNILKCCEHLNLYFDFYLPVISKEIEKSNQKSADDFKPGILGNYFVKSMESTSNKMKTASGKNPQNQNLDKNSISKLIENLQNFISVLEQSKSKNLEKIKINSSFSNLIKLKLGDTFRFIVSHNERHLKQAENLV